MDSLAQGLVSLFSTQLEHALTRIVPVLLVLYVIGFAVAWYFVFSGLKVLRMYRRDLQAAIEREERMYAQVELIQAALNCNPQAADARGALFEALVTTAGAAPDARRDIFVVCQDTDELTAITELVLQLPNARVSSTAIACLSLSNGTAVTIDAGLKPPRRVEQKRMLVLPHQAAVKEV